MLVSLAITLIMMGAVVTLFGTISDSVSGSRSIIEISERLRAARNRLQADLQGATATMKPPLRPENDEGYFEIIEGPERDASYVVEINNGGNWNPQFPDPSIPPAPPTALIQSPKNHRPSILPASIAPQALSSVLGDADDVLMFTVRSRGEPFVGQFLDATTGRVTTIESQVAEVAYFCAPALTKSGQPVDTTVYLDAGQPVRTMTLYRRVLLVKPELARSASFNSDPTPTPNNFYECYDLSAHVEKDDTGTWKMVPNSLGALTKREHRFAHSGVFPFDLNAVPPANFGGGYVPPGAGDFPSDSSAYLVPFFPHNASTPPIQRYGDDVMLTNVLAFDVQVYDPDAEVQAGTTAALTPLDPSYTTGGSVRGAYADLGWRGSTPYDLGFTRTVTPSGTSLVPSIPKYMNALANPPGLGTVATSSSYDTWSMHYENNGINDDGDMTIDEGTNGLDDDANGIVDDANEMETQSPFAAQLRGVRVTVRVYEPSSQQVRQMTVVGDFLPD